MGYESTLHLIDIKIKAKSLPLAERAISKRNSRGETDLQFFLERVVIDPDRFFAFKPSQDDLVPYVPSADDGSVPALSGKWYQAEPIARWLKRYSERGGRVILHSLEADGAAWGWEFDGRGRMTELALVLVGKWV